VYRNREWPTFSRFQKIARRQASVRNRTDWNWNRKQFVCTTRNNWGRGQIDKHLVSHRGSDGTGGIHYTAVLSPVRIQVFVAILRIIQTLYCPYITRVKDESRVTPDSAAKVTTPVPIFIISTDDPTEKSGDVA
jgi:hypothetical protein